MFRRRHALSSASDLDGIGIRDTDALQELPKPQLKAVVEAPQDRSIAKILLSWSVEVEYLFHQSLLDGSSLGCHLTASKQVLSLARPNSQRFQDDASQVMRNPSLISPNLRCI